MSASANADSDNPVPCATPNCGFWGRPSTGNFCSRCHKEKTKDEKPSTEVKVEAKQEKKEIENPARSKALPPVVVEVKPQIKEVKDAAPASSSDDDDSSSKKRKQENRMRCFECRKKLGLTGIECRCGFVFCGIHREPSKHNCEFDFEALAKEKYASRLTSAAVVDKIIGEKL